MSAFKKTMVITDLHFGRSGNNPVANQDNLDFLDWAIDEAKTWGAETCIMMGDWHDNRHQLGVQTMHYSLAGMEKLNDNFKFIFWIPGNHDLLYRDKRDVSSIEFSRHLPNIKLLVDPLTVDGVTFLPWLVGDEHKRLRSLKSRYVFSHLELPGFMMNAKVEMPETAHTANADDFKNMEYVFSGHFHIRQTKGNVVYTGNIMPFNFSDNWDDERGIMLLEWGKEPEFRSWPGQPLYRTMTLTDLLDNPDRLLRPKLTARISLDLDITYEEAQAIKDTFLVSHDVRKIELVHPTKQDTEQEYQEGVIFQSVDQMIEEGLLSVQSSGLQNELLVSIYRNLPTGK